MSAEKTSQKFNLSHHCLRQNAIMHANKTALVFYSGLQSPSEEINYEEVERKALQMGACLLASGLQAGSRIFIKLRSGPQFVSAFFGAMAVGMVPIPLSPLLSSHEVEKLVKRLTPEFICFEPEDRDLTCRINITTLLSDTFEGELEKYSPAEYAQTKLDDVAFMVLTSGTSSDPKIVAHGHRVVLGRQPMVSGWTDIKANDRVLHAGALNWTYSLGVALLDVFCASATSLLFTSDTGPDIWPEIIRHTDATIFAAVPSLYRRILKYGDIDIIANSRLRHGLCAGEPLLASLHEEWVLRSACPLFEALGMSEISTYISSSPTVPTRPGSPGKPQVGRRVCVLPLQTNEEAQKPGDGVQKGVIAVHGSDPGLMLGTYYEGELHPPPLENGWFVTGDLARIDEEGYVWYEGRSDDIMNISGYRVSPAEIESVLLKAHTIADVAVNTQEVSSGVRLITAHIVLSSGCDKGDAAREIERLCKDLAEYKRPRQLKFLVELPRTRNGKIKRSQL